jgi:hypothetical protein
MARVRTLIGPMLGGLAIWCAAGQLTVATASSAGVRLAVPAPWWILVLGVGCAALVPGWRRDPRLAAPALISTIPWWPVPVPAVALIWTGPLAWLPIALALGATLVWPARRWPPSTYMVLSPELHRLLAGLFTLIAVVCTAWFVGPRLPGGDEPHYLVITQSLLKDGDLQIQNNHDRRDYAAFFAGELRPDKIQAGRRGEVYSIHAPGVSALVLPAFALFGYHGAQATILALAVITGVLIWQIALAATSDRKAAWFAWAAVVLSPTFQIQSVTVFPDAPGALAVATGVWLFVTLLRRDEAVGPRALVLVSAALAALPWLHTRFAVLSAGLGAVIVWRLLVGPARPLAERRRRVLAFAAAPAASALLWFTFFYVLYGTPNPAAPYGANPEASWRFIPGGLIGLLFDQQFGLFLYSPVLMAAAAGLLARGQDRRIAWPAAGAALLYFMAVATYWMWWAGNPAPPARFAAAALPLLAVPAAIAWSGAGATRAVWRLLAVVSGVLALGVVGVDHGTLAWNMRDGEARWLEWLTPVANLPRAWPSFFWKLTPEDLSTERAFALHVLVWVGVFVGSWQALRLARRATPLLAIWWLPLALTIAAVIGWRLNDVSGLDPARSQLAVLTAIAQGRAGLRLDAWSIASLTTDRVVRELVVTGEEPGRTPGPPWLALAAVPPGTYELRFLTARPRQGEVAIRIGRAPRPLGTLALVPLSDQRQRLTLPAGAAMLTVEPDSALRAVGGRVELAPIVIDTTPTRPAQSAMRYGSSDVFFLDDSVFAEADGFWVRGGSTAELAMLTRVPNASMELILRNGAAPNQVTVDVNRQSRRLALSPGEEVALTLPVEDPAGTLRLRITSASGFRPSDLSTSRDERYLGVWVGVR